MSRVAVIQARMTSTRLPGKVLMDVAGQPMLAQQIRRLKHCQAVDRIVVATTANLIDLPVVELARREGVAWFCGSEHDVLSRYVGAAREHQAEIVIRITADCPLIDPQLVDRVTLALADHAADYDYASNVLDRTYPRGLDVEALYWDALLRVDRLAQSKAAREHVTTLIRSEQPELFLCHSVIDSQDNSDLRWTVDTDADLRLIRTLYTELGLTERVATYSEILTYVRTHPGLSNVNADIKTWEPS